MSSANSQHTEKVSARQKAGSSLLFWWVSEAHSWAGMLLAGVRSQWSSYHHAVYALAPKSWQCCLSARLLEAPKMKTSSAKTQDYVNTNSCKASKDLCIHSSC